MTFHSAQETFTCAQAHHLSQQQCIPGGPLPAHSPPQLHGSFQATALISNVQGRAAVCVLVEHVGLVLGQHSNAVQAAVARRVAERCPPLVVLRVDKCSALLATACEQRFRCPRAVCRHMQCVSVFDGIKACCATALSSEVLPPSATGGPKICRSSAADEVHFVSLRGVTVLGRQPCHCRAAGHPPEKMATMSAVCPRKSMASGSAPHCANRTAINLVRCNAADWTAAASEESAGQSELLHRATVGNHT